MNNEKSTHHWDHWQDGSYLAELLLAKGYEVHGPNARLFLHYGDLANGEQLSNLIYNVKPDEIYHLGAQSHVFAKGSTSEVQSQLHFILDLGYISQEEFSKLYNQADEVAKLISGFIRYLKKG